MERLFYVFGAILLWRIVQADVTNDGLAFIEDMRESSTRVTGGWPAVEGQFPYQVSLRMVSSSGSVSSCGGSIIHHQWVITAAHCLANRLEFVVRLGLINLTRPEYIVETTRRYIHPRYIEFISLIQTDDIALLGLNQHIPYGPNIQPCRLQNREQRNTNYKGVVLTVSGYGLTRDYGNASEVLQWTHLRGITNAECFSWYPTYIIRDRTICTEYYNDTIQSSCYGDSGGPLVLSDLDGKPTMVGIVSFGHVSGCSGPYPSAYVRPGHYHDWFTEVTGLDFDWKVEDLEASTIGSQESPDEVLVKDITF